MAAGMDYLAAWRQGSGAQWWVTGVSYDDFKAKDKGHFDEGLRLVCLRLVDGKFTGVWHPGSGAQWWVTGLNYADFKAKDKTHFDEGLRLYDIEIHNGLFTAFWRPGSGAQWWYFGDDFGRDDGGSVPVLAAAPGKVIFIGWDSWSGNTMVLSHDSAGVKDAFRTIYMHLRNGPTNDANNAWNVTVPTLSEPRLTQYK